MHRINAAGIIPGRSKQKAPTLKLPVRCMYSRLQYKFMPSMLDSTGLRLQGVTLTPSAMRYW